MARHDSRRAGCSGRHQPELPVRDRNWPAQRARRIAAEIRPRAGRADRPSDPIRSGNILPLIRCVTAGLTTRLLPKLEYHLNPASHRRRRSCHDLCPVSPAAAAWAARERAAVFGDLQPVPDRLLRDFRAVFSRPAAGAVGARADRRSYETGRAHAPAGGGGDPPVRPATGLSSLTLAETGLLAQG